MCTYILTKTIVYAQYPNIINRTYCLYVNNMAVLLIIMPKIFRQQSVKVVRKWCIAHNELTLKRTTDACIKSKYTVEPFKNTHLL